MPTMGHTLHPHTVVKRATSVWCIAIARQRGAIGGVFYPVELMATVPEGEEFASAIIHQNGDRWEINHIRSITEHAGA